ncbi:MAG: polysaccharide biosynthesis/export family protein [Planctomycetes bacterium]|nr:polysaccharide biosynthesis/export family protein [Planctomycetota bacterium]
MRHSSEHPCNVPGWCPLGRLWGQLLLSLSLVTGCYAPLRTHGIPARELPDSYRTPVRTAGEPLNYATLTMPPQEDYILGPNDVLEVIIHPRVRPDEDIRPVRVTVMASGNIQLPLVNLVHVAGLNLLQAHEAITKAYIEEGDIKDPGVNVTLVEKSTTTVLVLGEVRTPGPYKLPKGETDVAHAIAVAGGLTENAGNEIEVHRRPSLKGGNSPGQREPSRSDRTGLNRSRQLVGAGEPDTAVLILAEMDHGATPPAPPHKAGSVLPVAGSSDGHSAATDEPGLDVLGQPLVAELYHSAGPETPSPARGLRDESTGVLKIPLRGLPPDALRPEDVTLNTNDVVKVPSREDEVFYVVGKLNPQNFVRLTTKGREMGGGFLLPRDREVDVVTAVAMAGYIDPIESPTHISVQRQGPDGQPMMIKVDLFKARYDRRENLLVQAGDIVYLDPDPAWWTRRTFDRIVDNMASGLFLREVVRR